MSVRGWGGSVGIAAGIAAGAGAAQVGLGYGLGVLHWPTTAGADGESAWLASLTWAVWIAATATVAGALGAVRFAATAAAGESGQPRQVSWPARSALAVAAAVGGALSVLLVAIPAREATAVAGPGAQRSAAGYALAGIALGLLIAVWALSSSAVARNVVVTVGWLWTLAVATVVIAVATGRAPAGARLGGGPDWASGSGLWFRGYLFWPAAALSLGAAFVIGAMAAWSVARRTDLRVGATISGGVGPAVIAAAHLVVPGQEGLSPVQLSAHLTAPYAVIAGLAGSALAAGFAQRRAGRTGDTDTSRADVDSADVDAGDVDAGDVDRAGTSQADAAPPVTATPTTSGTAVTPAATAGGSGSSGTVPDQRTPSERRD